jgi:membrane-associated phospholipid phosphatase
VTERDGAPCPRSGPDLSRFGGRLPKTLGPACLLAFVALATAVATSSTVALPGDTAVVEWAVHHRPAAAVSATRALTSTGTGVVPYLLAAVAGLIAARGLRARLWGVVVALAVLLVGQALRRVVLALVARPRPPAADWAAHASNWSFPSGHATTSAITAGLLIGAVLVRAPRYGTPLIALFACWGAAVGLTRAYLAVHWAGDVVGGWLFATAWLCLCALLLDRSARLQRRGIRGAQSPRGAPPRGDAHDRSASRDVQRAERRPGGRLAGYE